MTDYGVLATGFSRKRLPEIKASLQTNIAANLGVPISTGADSVMGNLIGTLASEFDVLWQQAETVYNAMYPNSAEGVSLTNSVAFTGVKRISAESTKLYVTCFGTSGTVLPVGSTISDTISNYYLTNEEQTISLANATTLILSLASVTTGYEYGLIVDGNTISYTALSTDTVSSVLTALIALLPTGFTGSFTNGVLTISKIVKTTGVAMSYGSYFTFVSAGSPVIFYAENTGALDPTIGTMTNIITVVSGWSTINNEVAAIVGRAVETDMELRQRYASVVASAGVATKEAIKANILQLDNVTECVVFENDTDITDSDGRPPHSMEAVVLGGDGQEIAQTIWNTKAPGIVAYGSESSTITDSSGIEQTVYFNRPEEIDVYIKCTVHAQSGVTLSSDISTLVTNIIINNSFSISDDVILQKIAAQVINGISGLSYVEVEGSLDGITYTATNIPISMRQSAMFSTSKTTVVLGA